MECTCPSGLRVNVRKLKTKTIGSVFGGVGGRKGRGRGRKKGARGGAAKMNPLIDQAIGDVLDPGVYRFDGDRPGDVSTLLSGDRTELLLRGRQKTFGSRYEFRTHCRALSCREPINWTVDLDELLEEQRKPLPDESKEIILAGTPFVYALEGDGTPIEYHLGTGKDEARVSRQVDPVSASVLSRLDKFGDETNFTKLVEIVEELDADILDEIRAVMEEADCGVDTAFDIECDECGEIMEIDLPFDRTFFMPRSGARKK